MDGLRFRVGMAHIRFDLDLNFGYNDNIFAFNSPRVGDYITTVSPTIEVGFGNYPRPRPLLALGEDENYFFLRYTPSYLRFLENPDQNTVNENLSTEGRYTFSRLSLDGAFSYLKTTNPAPTDLGRQEYSIYALTLKAEYALAPKTFFEVAVNGSYTDYLTQVDYTTVSLTPSLGYQVGPKLRLSLGPSFGVTYVEGGGKQPFEGLILGIQYDSLRKLVFRGTLGVQATQFEGPNPANSEDFIAPVFALGATYTINETSSISLDLNQGVGNSGSSGGQALLNTSVSLSYTRRFFDRIQFDLSGNWQRLEYQGTGARTDIYATFSCRLGYLFWQQRCNAYLTYVRSQRFSEVSAFEYVSNFLGTGLGVEF